MDFMNLRGAVAYACLAVFVLSTSIGFAVLEPWAGFVSLGLTCGVAALLLGLEDGAVE